MKIHTPVLQNEVIKNLAPQKNENFIDATVGFAGHANLILKKTAPKGKLLVIDQDWQALEEVRTKLDPYGERVSFAQANFTELGLLIRDWQQKEISGILFDLGPNTDQLLDQNRGLSFRSDASLDMRMSKDGKLTAADIVNKYSEKDIAKILYDGEEKFARSIAKNIVMARVKKPIITTTDLVAIIRRAMPPKYRFQSKSHFATDTFRALRIKVNDEINNLENVLPQAVQVLSPGGRLVIITFHSLEDRIVKNYFRNNNSLEIINNKPIMAAVEEIETNPSARSAKLRVAIKKENNVNY